MRIRASIVLSSVVLLTACQSPANTSLPPASEAQASPEIPSKSFTELEADLAKSLEAQQKERAELESEAETYSTQVLKIFLESELEGSKLVNHEYKTAALLTPKSLLATGEDPPFILTFEQSEIDRVSGLAEQYLELTQKTIDQLKAIQIPSKFKAAHDALISLNEKRYQLLIQHFDYLKGATAGTAPSDELQADIKTQLATQETESDRLNNFLLELHQLGLQQRLKTHQKITVPDPDTYLNRMMPVVAKAGGKTLFQSGGSPLTSGALLSSIESIRAKRDFYNTLSEEMAQYIPPDEFLQAHQYVYHRLKYLQYQFNAFETLFPQLQELSTQLLEDPEGAQQALESLGNLTFQSLFSNSEQAETVLRDQAMTLFIEDYQGNYYPQR